MEVVEVLLSGTPDMALGVVDMVLSKPAFRRGKYSLDRQAAFVDKCFIIRSRAKSHPVSGLEWENLRIGILTFQLLPDGKHTLFRVPAPQLEDNITSGLGFNSFLNHLFIEFQRLGFVDFKEEKPPIGFRLPYKEKRV